MQKSLIINSVAQSGAKKYQKAITYINPDVSNEKAGTFAQMANALTTNVLGETQIVKKMSTSEEDSVTLTVDDSRIKEMVTVFEHTVSTIEGGIRIAFNAEDGNGHGMTPENTYIDVTY